MGHFRVFDRKNNIYAEGPMKPWPLNMRLGAKIGKSTPVPPEAIWNTLGESCMGNCLGCPSRENCSFPEDLPMFEANDTAAMDAIQERETGQGAARSILPAPGSLGRCLLWLVAGVAGGAIITGMRR